MKPRPLGKTGLLVSPIGFGAFKIGRNEKTKYREAYALPDDAAVERLLDGLLDLGVTHFDTAPAYGLSEERIGRVLSHRRNEFTLSTKVGETFENGRSHYDFSAAAVRASIERSLRRLQTDVLDVVFIHSNGEDLAILESTETVPALLAARQAGLVRAVGFSGKTPEGARRALEWADAIMVEYHLEDRSHEAVIAVAGGQGVGVVIKKGLASGALAPADAIRFLLKNPAVGCAVIGGLNLEHLRANVEIASRC